MLVIARNAADLADNDDIGLVTSRVGPLAAGALLGRLVRPALRPLVFHLHNATSLVSSAGHDCLQMNMKPYMITSAASRTDASLPAQQECAIDLGVPPEDPQEDGEPMITMQSPESNDSRHCAV